jgi:hypothetical protein
MSWHRACIVLIGLALGGCSGKDASSSENDPASDPGPGSNTNIPDPPTGSTPASYAGPTWYQDIAPLMADRCGACHRSGGVAPFSIETYEEALAWGPAMLNAIESGSMPPFYATESAVCDMEGLTFLDDIRLSDEEKQLVRDWVDAEMPAGDPTTAAPAELRQTEDLEDADLELSIQEPFAVEGDDTYECFRIPLPNTETMYLQALQVVPDNDLVVHHVLVWTDPNDSSAGQAGSDGNYGCSGFPDIFPTELAGTWTPGSHPITSPQGTGMPLEPGSSLVLNIHYHPTGTSTEFDQTSIRLKWTDEEPLAYTTFYLVDLPFGAVSQPGPNDEGGPEFRIPAGVDDHIETVTMTFADWLFTADMTVFSVTPHMHYLGTEMLVNIEHTEPGGDDQCLVHTPGFRFDFQTGYVYDVPPLELPVIHQGDRVRVQCRYNNSTSNPFMPLHLDASNASEPHDVWWGEETGDEMCMAMVGLIVPTTGWSPLSWF